MANYNINSGNLTALGTANADNFYFRTGGGPNVVVNAAAGNDSAYIEDSEGATAGLALDQLYLALQGGADFLTVSASAVAADASATTIGAGAGGDSLNFTNTSALTLSAATISLGDGSDSFAGVFASLADGTQISGGSGADTVTISATAIASGSVLLGSGADNLTFGAGDARNSRFNLGGGNDVGNFDISTAVNDTLDAGDGDDSFTLSANAVVSGSLLGGAGADSITISAGEYSATTINAGDGNDVTSFVSNAVTLRTGVSIISGAGNDSIYFSGAVINTGVQTLGGAGLDTINIANLTADNANALVISYNAPSETTSTAYDRIIASAGQTAVVRTNNLALQETNNGTYSWGYIANGVAFFTGGTATLTSAIDALDDVLNVGQAVAFSAQGTDPYTGNLNNNSYLFIQGGGQNGDTSADYVIQAGTTSAGSGVGQVGRTRVDTSINTLNVKFN